MWPRRRNWNPMLITSFFISPFLFSSSSSSSSFSALCSPFSFSSSFLFLFLFVFLLLLLLLLLQALIIMFAISHPKVCIDFSVREFLSYKCWCSNSISIFFSLHPKRVTSTMKRWGWLVQTERNISISYINVKIQGVSRRPPQKKSIWFWFEKR